MKFELEPSDIEAIAQKFLEVLKPHLNPKQEYDILDITEAAKLLGKSKGQVYQWVSDASHGLGDFPYMKAGKSLRFSKKAIIEWMIKNGKNG